MYYLISDYIIFRNSGVSDGETVKSNNYSEDKLLAEKNNSWSIYIVPTSDEQCHLIIKTDERNIAYRLAYLIRGFYTVIIQISPFASFGHDCMLYEFINKPTKDWDDEKWLNELNPEVHDYYAEIPFLKIEINRGTGIFTYLEEELLVSYLTNIFNNDHIIESLNHLFHSYCLFDGNMNGSYYHAHYKRDRYEIKHEVIEKFYYESKQTYELAFLSAFKGIESLLKVNDIKKKQIKMILANCEYDFIDPNNFYTRYFEIFSGHEEQVKQEDLIRHFIELRNTVGAHANKQPPKNHIITSDNIYEIQFFLSNMINLAIQSHIKSK